MIKVRIHIKNENTGSFDNRVCVNVELPASPRKGEVIYLSAELRGQLESKVRANLNVAKDYAPKWFYNASFDCREPNQKDLENFGFDDALFVCSVAYKPNSEVVLVELDDK